ncbi:MAG: carboxy terminal-processing peptidase [Silvanigrellaceae bacterium]
MMKRRGAVLAFSLGLVMAASLGFQVYVYPKIRSTLQPAAAQREGARRPANAGFLGCSTIQVRVRDFLKAHYQYRRFDEELSKRTFERYFQILDPGRNFFLAEDIATFAKMQSAIPDSLAKNDCNFISDIYTLYLKRMDESVAMIGDVLKTPMDFTIDEKLETDRKKIDWAKTDADRKERWRKLLKFTALNLRETEKDWSVIASRINKRYSLLKKSSQERTSDEVNSFFLNAFATSLDPHSQFMAPQDQEEFRVAFSLQLVGIGASLTQQEGYTTVEALIPGGAASRDGRLQKGDKIVAVDSGDGNGFVDVIDMDLSKVVQLIRGQKGTVVKLQILRKDAMSNETKRELLELERDVVHIADSEAHSDVMTVGNKKIGVINLPSFYIDYQGSKSGKSDYVSSSNHIDREIKKLTAQKVDGIVLDLRRNGGGDLDECLRLTGFFIDKGPVVQVQNRDGSVESKDDPEEGVRYSGPLAVLISKQSASASEILSGAIQDYGRGLIIGNSRTYGKATVQSVIDLPGTGTRDSDGAMKVTISKFFRPSGRSNQVLGVESDVQIPDVFEVSDVGEGENDFPLPHSTINASNALKPLQDLSKVIPQLKQKSEARVRASEDFRSTFVAIEKAKKDKDNTEISLKAPDKPLADATDAGKGQKVASTAPLGSKTQDTAADKGKSANPKANKAKADDPNVVIRPDDEQLHEAGRILVDSIELLGGKADWSK